MSMRQTVFVRFVIVLLWLFACAETWGATVFGSIFTNPGQLVRIDTVSGLVTPLLVTGASPDSLIFDSSGRIIYTLFGANQVRRFDPVTSIDTLVSGGFSGPLDLALEPGGQTVLVSSNIGARIDRLNLSTGVVTPFFTTGGGGGVTYDASGRLYAVLPGRLVELNPVSGAVLQSTPGSIVLDGLTFDPSTGNLFATNGGGGQVFRFDRNNLAAGGQLLATLVASGGFVDGLAADGTGNLLIAVRILANESQSGLFQVNASTGAFNQVAFAPVLDDVAPLSGLGAPGVVGAPAAVPTLSEILLIALSIMLAGFGVRRLGSVHKMRRQFPPSF